MKIVTCIASQNPVKSAKGSDMDRSNYLDPPKEAEANVNMCFLMINHSTEASSVKTVTG